MCGIVVKCIITDEVSFQLFGLFVCLFICCCCFCCCVVVVVCLFVLVTKFSAGRKKK